MINLRQNKAFALTFSLIFIFLVVSFMAVYILSVASGMSQGSRLASEKRAYYIADAGLADAYQRVLAAGSNLIASSVCTDPNKPSTCSTPFIPSATTDNGNYSVGTTNGSYMVSIVYSGVPQTNYTITSTGTFGKISKTLQLKIMSASISHYAYWSNSEINPQFGGPLYWVGMPSVKILSNGPVHTNGQLNIYGKPQFHDPVTESNLPILSDGSLGNTPTSTGPNYFAGVAYDPSYTFTGGLTSDTLPVYLTGILSNVQTTASSGGLVLTGPSTIVFNKEGTITVTGTVKNSQGQTTATYNNTTINAPGNKVIYVQNNTGQTDGNATVTGTVLGQMTVGAEKDIYIGGNLQYKNDPRTGGNKNSTDLVSLVANQNITVIAASSPSALQVAGVMVAVNGSFQVDEYTAPKGNAQTAVLDQFGTLINNYIGAIGEMDMNGNLLGGYNINQTFDARLASTIPPGFPLTFGSNSLYTKVSIAEL